MGAGVVTVGRRAYAVGLYWENSPSGRVAVAAKEAASQPGQQADFYAIRLGVKDGRVPQFGLGQSTAGHRAGQPAFAACMANQQPGSWVGAFRLREGIVVTVVRDDLIVPDGDQLFIDEAEARDRLLQEISFGGLQRIYAPEAWAIPGADSMPVSLLLDERRDVKLQVVKTPKSVVIGAAAVVLLLIIGLGIGWYYKDQEDKRLAAEAEQLAALERLKNEADRLTPSLGQRRPPYPPPERKWEKAPSPMAVLENCRNGLAQVQAFINGWRMGQLNCSPSSISVSWNRDKGYSMLPKEWVVNEQGSTATASVALSHLTERGSESLLNPADVTRRYLTQNWPGSINRIADDPPPPPPPDYNGPWDPPPPPWIKRSFTLTVSDLPAEIPVYFADLPGVVVEKINYMPPSATAGAGSWSIEGTIYENRM